VPVELSAIIKLIALSLFYGDLRILLRRQARGFGTIRDRVAQYLKAEHSTDCGQGWRTWMSNAIC